MNKKKWIKRFLFIFLTVVLLLLILIILNYTVSFEIGNKFIDTYMRQTSEYSDGIKGIFLWNKLKKDIVYLGVIIILLIMLTFVLTGYFVERKTKAYEVKRCIESLKNYIKEEGKIEGGEEVQFINALDEITENYSIVSKHNNKYLIKDDMIANFAHDIKTPLASTIGFLNLIKNDKDISEKSRDKYIKIALEKSIEVEKQLEDLFYIARYDFEHNNKSQTEIDLYTFLNHLVDEFYPNFASQKLKVTLNVERKIKICTNLDELAKALGNILMNAVKYAIEPSTIKINARLEGGNLVLNVSNLADYISKQELSMIFNRFYRVDESRNPNVGGAGLGLAISKAIIENMKGQIKADYIDGEFIITTIIPNILNVSE